MDCCLSRIIVLLPSTNSFLTTLPCLSIYVIVYKLIFICCFVFRLSEWSFAPLSSFGLYVSYPQPSSAASPASSSPLGPTGDMLPFPTSHLLSVLEDDRLIYPLVTGRNATLHYCCRLLTAALFAQTLTKPRLQNFVFHQSLSVISRGAFDVFLTREKVARLAALSLVCSESLRSHLSSSSSSSSFSNKPQISPSLLPSLISTKTLPLLSSADWTTSIEQELADLVESSVESDDPTIVNDLEVVELQAAYCAEAFSCDFFGMEIWTVTANSLLLGENQAANSSLHRVPSVTLLSAASRSEPAPAPFDVPDGAAVLMGVNKNGISLMSPPLQIVEEGSGKGEELQGRGVEEKDDEAVPSEILVDVDFDADEGEGDIFSVSDSAAAVVDADAEKSSSSPQSDSVSRRRSSTVRFNQAAVVFNWDLFSIKCWSYSKTAFSWTELNTEVEYVVLTDQGYLVSGLLMDYALSIVAQNGAEPPCLKAQTLDQLGWRGGRVQLEEGKLVVNSLKVWEKQEEPK